MVLTINPGYCLKKIFLPCNRWSDVRSPLSINLRCYQNITRMLKYYKTNCIKLVTERKSINIDQSKVNNILKLFSKNTQLYDELLDENKQPLIVASKQYTVVINILIKSQ